MYSELIPAQCYSFKEASADLIATCALTNDEMSLPREYLFKLDQFARGLFNTEELDDLIDRKLVVSWGKQPVASTPRIGLVVTVKNPPAEFQNFLAIHAKTLASKIYVFLDDPTESLFVPKDLSQIVTLVRDKEVDEDNPVYKKNAPFFDREVMARQLWNVERALKLATRDGLDWLFHLDEDEILMLPQGPKTLATVPDKVGSVVVLNDEVAVNSSVYNNYFQEAISFKRNPLLLPLRQTQKAKSALSRRWYFTAYINGKSGVRVGQGAHPAGVHRFSGPTTSKGKALLPGARVLHFANCGFANFNRKYHLRKNMSDKYFERRKRISFHLAARDALVSGGEKCLEAFFQKNVYCSSVDLQVLQALEMLEDWDMFQY